MHSAITQRFVFNASALAGSAPQVLIDPSSLTEADGAAIANVSNLGALGGAFTQGTGSAQPTMRRNYAGTNNHAIDFDSGDSLARTGGASSVFGASGAASWTVCSVIDLDGLAAGAGQTYQDAPVLIDSGGFAGLTLRDNSGTPQVQAYRWSAAVARATMGGLSTRQIVSVTYTHGTTTSTARRGLNARTSVSGAFSAGLGADLHIGAYAGTTNRLDGKLLWLGAWSSALTNNQEEALIGGLLRKFGAA
jgi:hypothetical protein